jgi:hypothetical protein
MTQPKPAPEALGVIADRVTLIKRMSFQGARSDMRALYEAACDIEAAIAAQPPAPQAATMATEPVAPAKTAELSGDLPLLPRAAYSLDLNDGHPVVAYSAQQMYNFARDAQQAGVKPESLAKLGWQAIECDICGSSARAFPKATVAEPVEGAEPAAVHAELEGGILVPLGWKCPDCGQDVESDHRGCRILSTHPAPASTQAGAAQATPALVPEADVTLTVIHHQHEVLDPSIDYSDKFSAWLDKQPHGTVVKLAALQPSGGEK